MRMLLSVIFPNEPFNALVRAGTAGEILKAIMDDLRPEAVYFTEEQGCRACIQSSMQGNKQPVYMKDGQHVEENIIRSPAPGITKCF